MSTQRQKISEKGIGEEDLFLLIETAYKLAVHVGGVKNMKFPDQGATCLWLVQFSAIMGSTKTLVQAAQSRHRLQRTCLQSGSLPFSLSVLPAKVSAWRTGIQDLAFIKVLNPDQK